MVNRKPSHRPCSIEGCVRPFVARTLCDAHYKSFKVKGSLPPVITLEERFWSKVDKNGPIPTHRPDLGPCWLWTACITTSGYGHFWIGERHIQAHRYAYEQEHGPIPDGLVPDHLCRNRPCVNPSHIEPVTNKENTLRGIGVGALNAVKTQCPQGHEYTEKNTRWFRGMRYCRQCHAQRTKQDRERKRALRILETVTP